MRCIRPRRWGFWYRGGFSAGMEKMEEHLTTDVNEEDACCGFYGILGCGLRE